jgi:hypothetical protein
MHTHWDENAGMGVDGDEHTEDILIRYTPGTDYGRTEFPSRRIYPPFAPPHANLGSEHAVGDNEVMSTNLMDVLNNRVSPPYPGNEEFGSVIADDLN